jgi:hypothetical protein
MPEHGEYNEDLCKWYCKYWLTAEEWEDIHDYAPSSFLDMTTEKKNNNNTDAPKGLHKKNKN